MRSFHLAAFAAAFVVGCGGSEPPAKTAVKQTDTTATTTTTSTGTTKKSDNAIPNTETASNIHIDDAIRKACGIDDSNAYFGFDSANVTSDAAKPLDQVATCFISGPLKGKKMQLVGHADPRGDSDYNFALAQSRADSVGKYLSVKGVGKDQISSTSRGALDATGTDEPSWSKDRRVDILLAS